MMDLRETFVQNTHKSAEGARGQLKLSGKRNQIRTILWRRSNREIEISFRYSYLPVFCCQACLVKDFHIKKI